MNDCQHDNADTRKGRRCSSCKQNERYARDPEFRERRRMSTRERYKTLDKKVESAKRQLRRMRYDYGLDTEAYARLIERAGGKCELCQGSLRPGRGTHIDHDHTTGRVRGVLCAKCNLALGQIETPGFLDRANEYLRRYELRPR